MNMLIVLAVIAVLLFLLGFITKRRFGVLGLTLFAGSYLAHTWTGAAIPLIEKTGVNLSSLDLSPATLIAALFTIAPSLILLANSPQYHSKWAKIIGAFAYAVLAVILLVPVLNNVDFANAQNQSLIDFVTKNYTMLVTAGLIAAIIDLFLSRSHKKHSKQSVDKKHGEH